MSPMASAIQFAGPQKDLRGRLRQHGLGVVAVAGFELAAALEAEDERIVRLAVFGDGGVQLWEPLQAGELVEDKPRATGMGLPLVHESQDQGVQPEADQGHEAGARFRRAGQE